MATYIMQKIDSSFCPKCGKKVFLLCPKSAKDCGNKSLPWFYICFDCDKVSQIGVGPVELEK